MDGAWQDRQREYYDARSHANLRAEAGGRYAERIVERLCEAAAVAPEHRGLEVGCGAGRFTLPLLRRCRRVDALDLSGAQLARLGEAVRAAGLETERCRPVQADLERLDAAALDPPYDFALGVFILHHLRDPGRVMRSLAPLVRPGARVAFLEPNRWNPLYALQIAVCPDMSWREEWRLYQLGARRLLELLRGAGFEDCRVERSGLFPPQILNRFAAAERVERRVEGWRWARPALPFVVVSGRRPEVAP